MNERKVDFTYIISIIMCLLLYIIAGLMVVDIFEFRGFNLSVSTGYEWSDKLVLFGVAAIGIAIAYGLLYLVARLTNRFIPFFEESSIIRTIIRIILLIGTVLCGIYFGLNYLMNVNDYEEKASVVTKIFNGESTSITDTLKYGYLSTISFIYKFLGIKPEIYMYFNLILLLLALISLYVAAVKVFEKINAFAIAVFVMTLSVFYSKIGDCDESIFLFFIEALVIMFMSFFISKRYRSKEEKIINLLYIALMAVAGGCIAYMNISFAVIAVMFIFGIIYFKGDSKKSFLYILMYIMFLLISYGLMVVLDSYVYGWGLIECLENNSSLNALRFDNVYLIRFSDYPEEAFVIVLLALFGALFYTGKDRRRICYKLLGLTLTAISFCFLDNVVLIWLYLVFVAMLFSDGFNALLISGRIEDIRERSDYEYKKKSDDLIKEIDEAKESSKDTDLAFENIALNEEILIGKEEKIPETVKVELIENVLPEPKKHIKKEIDYEFYPSDEKMNFDIDLKENDDFDI